MRGWFRLYRRLLTESLWLAEPFSRGQAWVDLIGLANHADGIIRVRGNRIEIKRGQCGWSEVKLAERWKWSRGRVRRFLSELQNDGRIEQQKNTITTIITIVNYEFFQGDDTADDTADGQQTDSRRYTNKKDKKSKKNQEGRKREAFAPPTPAQVDEYAASIGYHRPNLGRDFVQHYDATDWRLKNGKPMTNWKISVQTWRQGDERRQRQSSSPDIEPRTPTAEELAMAGCSPEGEEPCSTETANNAS